ncbi:MAG: Dihydrofolate reductase [Paracidovorax wautersii]|uniref:Dihydrofolate reductase n=1 Tax=Paracidovorax wautersii TaxID=1177982 RepID=A0A7V8FPT4_9BURK|nr:MAG: Dihydrofolate reductase [Paracidovorax wautersii]
MSLSLIYAQAANGVIGRDNALPWHLPEDLAHFKRCTSGHPVVMGRKTWDSLPPAFRPLPGRLNIVVTRQAGWLAEGASVAGSLAAAVELAREHAGADAQVWVIGGAQIYAAALPLADQVVVTELEQAFEGDAHAPVLDAAWTVAEQDPPAGWHTARNGLRYRFRTLRRA